MVQSADLVAEEQRPLDHLRRGGRHRRYGSGLPQFPFAGWLVQRDIGKKLTLGTEAFYHGPEGVATPQTRPATMLDAGGYYKFRDPGFQLLFCYGHTVIGQNETYAYLGLYWTWGSGKNNAGSLPGGFMHL